MTDQASKLNKIIIQLRKFPHHGNRTIQQSLTRALEHLEPLERYLNALSWEDSPNPTKTDPTN